MCFARASRVNQPLAKLFSHLPASDCTTTSSSLARAVKDFGRQKGDPALDELPFGIWVGRAPTGEVLYTNDGFRTLLGLDHADGVDLGADAPVFYNRRGKPYADEDRPFANALRAG